MLRKLRKSKAQSLTEFAMVMALVLGAVAALQPNMRKAILGKIQFGLDTYNASAASSGGTTATEGTSSTNITETNAYGGGGNFNRSGNSTSHQDATTSF